MGKYLLNISNHPSSSWTDEQKKGWDAIYDIPFPEVTAESDLNELAEKVYSQILETLMTAAIQPHEEVCVMIKGDYGLSFKLFDALKKEFKVVHPVSIKNSVDEIQADGTIKKTIIYKFVKWIEI
jgi:hypothetical protein